MKWFEVSLKNMPVIVATYIVFHKFCIINIKGIKDEWIAEVENELFKRVSKRVYKKVVNYGERNKICWSENEDSS